MGRSSWPRRKILAWLPARLSLRVRLVATAVGLLAAGAGIIVVAGVLATRGYLTRQAERELRGYAGQLASRPFLLTPLPGSPPGLPGLSDLPVAGGGMLTIEVRGSGGRLVMRGGAGRLTRPGPHAAAAFVQASRVKASKAQVSRVEARRVQVSRRGGYLVIAVPIRYQAHRIPYAYSAEDFALNITSRSGTGTPGTLVVSLSLSRIDQATSRLALVMLAVSGLVVVATGGLAGGVIRRTLRPLAWLGYRADAIAAAGPGADAPEVSAPGTRAPGTRAPESLAIADTCLELRQPLSVLSGLSEYYRHRDQLSRGDFDRLLARVADETARIDAIIDDLQRPGRDEPGPPA